MACSIIRTGEVTTVFDEGGNVSSLFQEAMDEFNDVEQALDVFYTSRSQEFSENSGVFYRDATLNDVLRFYTNYGVSSSSVHVFSPKETVEVIDAMKNMGIKSIYELNEVMQDLFHNADGVFEIDAEKLVKSGYYTMEEALALESSDIIHTLNRLSKFVLTGFDIVVSDAEYSGYKNTTVQKNMFGAYPFISSLEVKQYIAENGLDSLEGTPYSFVLDNSLEGVSGKQRVKTKRKVKDITREDTVERLSKTSLANRVHILSSEGIRGVLDRIGFSEELKNQVISYRGIRKALDVLNTKTNHRDYGELMNGIYFGELPVALAFAGYNIFSPGLEEHSQLFKAKIDDSKFVTIDMKGHTPGSDENFIKIVGEERYLKLLEQKRSGEITGMKLINAPEFLHGEEKQVQYVVFDRELIELTASFRGKALQDLGAMTLRLSTEGVQLTPNGFVYRGDVYLNNDVYETETAVHEFSHLYLDRLKEVNPFLYERGIELIKTEGFEYITHVRRTQPNLVGERLYEEALAQAVGEEGAKIIDEGKRNKFLSFIRDLWESIKSSLGLSGMTYDQASKLNLKEYSRAIAIDLLSGEPLNNLGNKADSLNLNSVEFSFLEQSELDSQGNIRPEVARAIREERVRIENEARGNVTPTVGEVTQQLQKTRLAEKVHTLSPQQIEQELIRRGVDSNVAKQVADYVKGYYSNANVAFSNLKDKNVKNVQGWMKALTDVQKNGGIRNVNQELNWIGLEDYLNEYVKENNPKNGNIPASVVEEYILSNQIEIVDVSKGGQLDRNSIDPVKNEDGNWDILYKGKKIFTLDDYQAKDREEAIEVVLDADVTWDENTTKYSDYQLEGGENYREVLLTMPGKPAKNTKEGVIQQLIDLGYNVTGTKVTDKDGTQIFGRGSASFEYGQELKTPEGVLIGKVGVEGVAELVSQLNEGQWEAELTQLDNTYSSSHWDEANVLAHVRLNEKTLPDGRRVLIVNEVQSDWAQDGRKKGFAGSITKDSITKWEVTKDYGDHKQISFVINGEVDGIIWRPSEETEEQLKQRVVNTYNNISMGVLPANMPYRNTDQWVGLVTRRVMQMASQEGYDGIAFATGQQSADMYSLARQADELRYSKNSDGTYNINIFKDSGNIGSQSNVTEVELENYVGKEIAQRIFNNEGEQIENEVSLTGVDLEVGGEGMKTFYDKIIPKVVQKEARRFDKNAKLETVDFRGDYSKVSNEGLYNEYKYLVSKGEWNLGDWDLQGIEDNRERFLEDLNDVDNFSKGKLSLGVQPYLPLTNAIKESVSQGIPQFQTEGIGLLPNGFVDLNTREVFLNQETANLDTPVHEFSHLFTDILKQTNNQLYKRGLELIEKEGKEYIDFVKKNQPNLKGEALLDEALNQAVGEAGERIINKQSKFFQWLQDMWNSLKDMIGLTQYSWNEVKDMNLQQFTEAMAVDLLQGEELNLETNKAFNEGVEAVAKLADEYKKEFGIDSVRHNKVGKLFPAVSKMISEAYEQAETGMTSEEVIEAYKALEEETLQQYKFIVDKGLKVSRWTGEGEPYPNSKSMLKDVRENNHLYFLPNSEAFGKEGDEVEGRAGLKLTDVYLDDGYRMTLSEVFRVVHDYFGHGILGNQFGAVGEENATLQHLDLYSFKALPAVIFQTRGQNSWVNFSGVNDEALRKIREGSRTNNKSLLEEGQKEFRFATPKDNILPKIFNFKTYETARRINEQEEIRKSETYLDPRGTHEDTNISELLTRHTLRNSGKLNGFRRRSLGVSKRVGGYDVDVIAEYEGNKEVDKLIKDVFPRFKGTQKIYEITNGEVYRELMIEALETNKFKSSVTVHSAEDFSNMRLFVTEDGSTGITLTKDGFLGGAFGNPKADRPNNLAQMMLLGIKEGALTAEAFDTVLPNYYSLFGFKAVSRTAFNDEYRPLKENGALEDWDYELYRKFNNGRPDVVFFIYDGGDRGSIQSRLGQFDSYSTYQKDFTEYYDKDSYDDAYRFMEVEAINKSNYQNQEVDFQINETGQELQQIREQAVARGTFMKAPNGKSSNLSEEQWITVRTERFKSWYGDWQNDPQNASKVVDENNEPLVVYHATEKAFTEFKSEKSAQGVFWFSEDKGKIERGESGAESVSEIMPVFLNIRNIAGWNEYENKSIGEIERDGFDGVKLDDDYIAFNPNQIKSATDNIGTFNVKNNDIRFSISNSNTNFTEDETTRYYTDSQGKRIPFKRYSPHDDSTKSNLLQQEEGQGLGESTDFALVERQFIEDKNLNFTSGTRIESLNDVAWLFRSLENEAVENAFVVYIDEEGGYTVQHLGQGGITAAVIDSRLVVGNAVKYGAKSIAFVHNHPSGSLKASKADMTVFSRLRKGLEGTGVGLLDGVIINLKTGKYVTFDEYSDVVEEITEQNQEQHKVQVLSFSKQIFSENYNPVKIGGSRDVAELITTKRFGVSDKTEMLVLNNSNEVVGKFVLPEENQYAKITELLSQYGGASVILYGNKIDPSQIKDYNRRLEQIGATILDAIEVKSDNYTSLRDEGILYEPQRDYGVSPQENKTLQEAEEQEQLKRLNLDKLNEISEEYEQGNRIFKRLPQREQSGFTRIGRAGIEAAIHLDAVFGANEDGATNKAEQERALKEYAKKSNVWVEDVVQQKGEPHTEGQEALVWFNEDTNIVTKSILPLEQTPQEFLDRVSIHNSIFPETRIKVIGFTETKSGELQYIVEQPLVVFERGATQAEVSEMMSKLGFEHTGENDYANNETLIEDLHPGNALIDINTGRVAVIDAIIRLNTKEAGYGGERVVGTNNVSELEKSLAEEEVRQQEVEQENIFKRDVLNTLVKNNLISNDTFLQLSSLESFNVENVSSILRNNEEAFEGMSDRSIGKKLMSITPVNFEHVFNKWGESFSNEYIEDYVDSLIRNNVVEMRDEDNNICASHGLFFNGVKFGGTWKVVKDLKGKPSHKRGGVEIQLTEKGVKVAKGGAEIIAEKGLVFSSRFDVSDKGLRGGSKWFIEKDLKGYRSHNKGGVDVELTGNGVYLIKEGSPEIIAKDGVLILNEASQGNGGELKRILKPGANPMFASSWEYINQTEEETLAKNIERAKEATRPILPKNESEREQLIKIKSLNKEAEEKEQIERENRLVEELAETDLLKSADGVDIQGSRQGVERGSRKLVPQNNHYGGFGIEPLPSDRLVKKDFRGVIDGVAEALVEDLRYRRNAEEHEEVVKTSMNFEDLSKMTKDEVKELQKTLIEEGYLDKGEEIDVTGLGREEIKDVQKRLKGLGFDLGSFGKNKDGVDGIVGRYTRKAIEDYNSGLGVDGIVGDKTRAAFKNKVLEEFNTLEVREVDKLIRGKSQKDQQNILAKNGWFRARESDFNFNTDNILLTTKGGESEDKVFKINPSNTCNTPYCGRYVYQQITEVVGSKTRNEIDAYDDAWRVFNRLEKAGGQVLYNAFPDKKPKLKQDKASIEAYFKKITEEKPNLVEDDLKSGDVVNMYYGGSDYAVEAYRDGGTVFSTHLGIVKEDDKGKKYVEHNVGGTVYLEPLEKILNNKSTTSRGKPLRITAVTRPSYSKESKPVDIYEPTETAINFDVVYNLHTPFGKKEGAVFTQTIINNKEVLMNDIPISEVEFDNLLKASRVIGWNESRFQANPKPKWKDLGGRWREARGGREASMGYSQMKDEENFTDEIRKRLNINDETLMTPEKSGLATMYLLSSKYLKIRSSLDKDVNLTPFEVATLALMSWNMDVDGIIRTINKYKTLDKTISRYREEFKGTKWEKEVGGFPYGLAVHAFNEYLK